MAFFDKVGETISSKSKDVIKKAKDLAEISSLNGQINSQEEVINKTYSEIGQTYFEIHKDLTDDIYATQCDIIKIALEKIQHLKQDINSIKNAQICPNCGAEIATEVVFCSVCGIKIVAQTPEVIKVPVVVTKACPQCGATISDDSAFCTSCGEKLS
ncbi:zinc ribbon domain-containing protein [Clostridium sp. E02]|uniref:zinc ribbon domain-containing protein n=1 Tax=Clostridium sp. E02 TaxID=2487134 RepID=UPI000F548F6B|nr:zinc ribbon domain-containing protein [Clostridium sp. E02]